MSEVTVDLLVEGGSASAGAKLGTTLGPLKINIGEVVNAINKETSAFKGMQVPVKVIVNPETKEFTIKVGSPPTSQLLLKEVNAKKGAGVPHLEKIGNLGIEQVIKITIAKASHLMSSDFKNQLKEVLGTCQSMGILVEGKEPKQVIKEINEGAYSDEINSRNTEVSPEKQALLKKQLEEINKKYSAQLNEIKAKTPTKEGKTDKSGKNKK